MRGGGDLIIGVGRTGVVPRAFFTMPGNQRERLLEPFVIASVCCIWSWLMKGEAESSIWQCLCLALAGLGLVLRVLDIHFAAGACRLLSFAITACVSTSDNVGCSIVGWHGGLRA